VAGETRTRALGTSEHLAHQVAAILRCRVGGFETGPEGAFLNHRGPRGAFLNHRGPRGVFLSHREPVDCQAYGFSFASCNARVMENGAAWR
jgi:hypothetical protein